jgi:hypothetical protein
MTPPFWFSPNFYGTREDHQWLHGPRNGQNDLMRRIFIKKYFLFAMGSVCRVKRFTTGSRNSLKDVRKSQMLPDEVRKWLRQQSKDFCAAGFDAMGQVYRCWWTISREINFFIQFRISYILRFISICDLFTDSSSYLHKI